MSKVKPCVVCKGNIAKNAKNLMWLLGVNASPLSTGQACDRCEEFVLMARIELERITRMAEEKANRGDYV